MIVLNNVSKTYGEYTVLRDVSLRINPGELLCITGPSGAGKSTLLHMLTGAEEVTGGQIEVDGIDLRAIPAPVMQLYRRRIGVVFQDYKLLGNRTVAENIAFPLEVCGVPDAEISKRTEELLTRMELLNVRNTLPAALSGGEKARTAIARAIAHKPMILLADEPTGNVDPDQSVAIMELFKGVHAAGTTVIIATHDSGLVDALQTRVITLGEGSIVRDSVGGYEEQRSAAKKASQQVVEAAVHKPKHQGAAQNTSESSGKRKVKITAIR